MYVRHIVQQSCKYHSTFYFSNHRDNLSPAWISFFDATRIAARLEVHESTSKMYLLTMKNSRNKIFQTKNSNFIMFLNRICFGSLSNSNYRNTYENLEIKSKKTYDRYFIYRWVKRKSRIDDVSSWIMYNDLFNRRELAFKKRVSYVHVKNNRQIYLSKINETRT